MADEPACAARPGQLPGALRGARVPAAEPALGAAGGHRRAALARGGGAAQAQLPNTAGRSRQERPPGGDPSRARRGHARHRSRRRDHAQPPTAEDSRLENPIRSLQRTATLTPARTCCDDPLNPAPVHRCDRGSVRRRRRPAAVRGKLDARGTHQHAARTGRSGAGSTGVPGRDRGDGGAFRCVGRSVGRRAPGAARRGGRAGGRRRWCMTRN